MILKGMISITLSENCSEKHLPVGVFPYDISLKAASEMKDENILLKIGGTDMISKEAKYHQGCKVNYLNKYKKFIEQ